MRNRIFGAIGVIWGGAILASAFLHSGITGGSGAYAAGHEAGVVFGALIFVAGAYYLIKGGGAKNLVKWMSAFGRKRSSTEMVVALAMTSSVACWKRRRFFVSSSLSA